MQEKPTDELNDLLESAKPGHLEKYFEDNAEYMADGDRAFYKYMKKTIRSKGIFLKDVYSFAGLTESYGSKLLTMERHTTDRDHIIRLCIAGHLTWNETNRALKLYGFNELYPKHGRDVCLISSINNREYDLAKVDDNLEKYGFPKLSTETE